MKLIDKSNTPKPENTFSRSQLFTADYQPKKAGRKTKKTPKKVSDITSVRCTLLTAARLNALVGVMKYANANELIDVLITNYEKTLTATQKREFAVMVSVHSRRNK